MESNLAFSDFPVFNDWESNPVNQIQELTLQWNQLPPLVSWSSFYAQSCLDTLSVVYLIEIENNIQPSCYVYDKMKYSLCPNVYFYF